MMSSAADFAVTATPKSAPGLEFRAVGSEQLVHDPATGRVHVLNATGALVLTRCDGATTLAQIIADLASSSNVDSARVAADVVAVCAAFRENGLIS